LRREIFKAQATFVLARQEFDRKAALVTRADVSVQQEDEAWAEAAVAEADMAVAQARYAEAQLGPTREERAMADAQRQRKRLAMSSKQGRRRCYCARRLPARLAWSSAISPERGIASAFECLPTWYERDPNALEANVAVPTTGVR
jgi:hypothetical protein